jgi:hypothetical protein
VHGGASGIGTTAIQLAKSLGAKVLVTVGSKEQAERCVELGADAAINYKDEDFVARVGELTGGHGADVILDSIGAAYLMRNVETLADSGRLVVIGLQGGVRAELDISKLLFKRQSSSSAWLLPPPARRRFSRSPRRSSSVESLPHSTGWEWPASRENSSEVATGGALHAIQRCLVPIWHCERFRSGQTLRRLFRTDARAVLAAAFGGLANAHSARSPCRRW